ncbi:unnamed protein product [Owenia fusiformis]|uniref:Spliceosome-associated protein CWC27 homolog n=1 Tax=Owenia fusiformis TaxID=6347 RepID=A0A8J1U806_OWEFU|nr:unnamed protein product [Owenia fusiformis]
MSNIYIQEPPTNGKVLVVTSCGDIDIELWSKETPKAARNFIQLCLEGYYDGTLFHRVIPDFIVQGGDPTGTGEGGESVYGKPFRDEFHSRLRFVRRGLVAMANAGQHDNASQFFFTLGATPELNNKHTIFGKVGGQTVYNMIRLAEVDIGSDDRPRHPHKIIKTKVLHNPFDDIVPRDKVKKTIESEKKKKKSQSKATKNFNLLSFGEEAEEDEVEVNVATKHLGQKKGGKSSHELTDDPKLSAQPAMELVELDIDRDQKRKANSDSDEESKAEMKEMIKKKLKKDKEEMKKEEPERKTHTRSEELREEVRQLQKELSKAKKKKLKSQDESPTKKEEESSQPTHPLKNDPMAEFREQRKKFKELKKSQARKGAGREAQTMALLSKFQNKLHAAVEASEDQEEEKSGEEIKDTDDSWLAHKLVCDTKDGKVLDANVDDSDRYEIFDPRNPMNKRRRESNKKSEASGGKRK